MLQLPLEPADWTRGVDIGRREVGRGSKGQNTRDRPAGFGSTQGRSEMAGGEKSGLVQELSKAEGKRGGSEDGASYLERVLSARCFCWLSACLRKRKGHTCKG